MSTNVYMVPWDPDMSKPSLIIPHPDLPFCSLAIPLTYVDLDTSEFAVPIKIMTKGTNQSVCALVGRAKQILEYFSKEVIGEISKEDALLVYKAYETQL